MTIDVSPDILRRQLTIVGSWTFSWQGQADCAEFVVDRDIDVDRLFTHRWQLDQAEEAYRLFDTQTTGKGVFLPVLRLETSMTKIAAITAGHRASAGAPPGACSRRAGRWWRSTSTRPGSRPCARTSPLSAIGCTCSIAMSRRWRA